MFYVGLSTLFKSFIYYSAVSILAVLALAFLVAALLWITK